MIHINSYLFSKISNIISIFFIKKRILSKGIYLIGKSNKAKDSKIIVDLSDPDKIHIGDAFFFEPILKIIKIANELITINKLEFVNEISKIPIFISGPIL